MSKISNLKFYCSICDYTSSRKGDFNKHLLSRKHKILTGDLQENFLTKKSEKDTKQNEKY